MSSAHSHPLNQDEFQAQEFVQKPKEQVEANSAQPPSQLVRDELAAVPLRVLSQLPEMESLRKAIQRERGKNLPPNPKSKPDLDDVIAVSYTHLTLPTIYSV